MLLSLTHTCYCVMHPLAHAGRLRNIAVSIHLSVILRTEKSADGINDIASACLTQSICAERSALHAAPGLDRSHIAGSRETGISRSGSQSRKRNCGKSGRYLQPFLALGLPVSNEAGGTDDDDTFGNGGTTQQIVSALEQRP